jgi:hypothetical protein
MQSQRANPSVFVTRHKPLAAVSKSMYVYVRIRRLKDSGAINRDRPIDNMSSN